ncbi:protein INCA1-like isoform X2 [Leucoraja erinacea]|uniref:protein INCA1-like isoform X2 n=1 Tax=Leucoraja erinaceus TaxID=7782 RepID=UPI0024578A10|nr:protein INCA1-like isoform X2 [Leucoraja erinacea]
MTQPSRTPWSVCDGCEEENEDNFIPFVTRSRMVSRRGEGSGASGDPHSPPTPVGQTPGVDLERLLLPPGGLRWMELYKEASPRLSGHAVERAGELRGGRGYSAGRLPSPWELYGRRKGHSRRPQRRPGMAVTAHLEELKRRQSCIDQLKALKWGSVRSMGSSLEQEGEQQRSRCPSTTRLTHSPEMEVNVPCFQPRWSFGVQGPGSWFPAGEQEEKVQRWGCEAETVTSSTILWAEE